MAAPLEDAGASGETTGETGAPLEEPVEAPLEELVEAPLEERPPLEERLGLKCLDQGVPDIIVAGCRGRLKEEQDHRH